jgi:tetratricopeptide (TPR) repeat protein
MPPPEMFSAPSQAPYGTAPGMYPPGFVPAPGGPGFPPPQKALLPRWFTIGATVLVVVGLFLVWLTGSDWANGAVRAGIGALVVGAIVLVAFLFRFTQGYRATRTMSLAIVSILLLIVVGTAGLTLQGPIHSLQGGALDGQQKFAPAISEYAAAGDTLGLARTYNDWGEFLLKRGNYAVPDDPTQAIADGALAKFNYVLDSKHGLTTSTDPNIQDQVTRAREGFVNTVLAWGDAHVNSSDYQGAVARFKLVLDQKNTYGATSGFPKLHQEAAKAYYGLGQQQVTNGDCTDAVQTYQIVVTDYSDTPQGSQASADLKKPQSVTGQLVDVQKNAPAPHVRLYLTSNYTQALAGQAAPSHDYTTLSDSSGNFTFANIAPGQTKYLISYIQGSQELIIVSRSSGQPDPKYIVQVGPLCATSVGAMPYDLPGA